MNLYNIQNTKTHEDYSSLIHIRDDVIAGETYVTFRCFYTEKMFTFKLQDFDITAENEFNDSLLCLAE
ncbi:MULTISPECIES: hypothetical protein [Bacillus]|uniref:hypothetical protein n=1 Tax=Bacillus TaxID=1386 RepID=UPI000C78BE52|nr:MULTISPECIES: hypothetical protein [Bacillus]MCP1161252.1 hypothetical protein [Bacillus infantis]PLR70573.1 hypothetical protein CYJ37_23880 [Bacillus sp. UMB0728]